MDRNTTLGKPTHMKKKNNQRVEAGSLVTSTVYRAYVYNYTAPIQFMKRDN